MIWRFKLPFILFFFWLYRKKSSRKRADNADVPISLRSTSYARGEVASIDPEHYQYVDLPSKELCYQNMSVY